MAQKKQKYQNPVIYYESNLIFARGTRDLINITGKECWACYRWQGFNYDFLQKADKIEKLFKNSRAFQQVFSEAHLLQIPLKNNMTDNMNYLRSIATGEMKALGLQYIDNAEYMLEDADKKETDYETYFMVKLKKPRTLKDFKDLLISLYSEPYRAINEFIALDVAEIYQSEFEAFKTLEQSLRKNIKRYINIKEINEVDIERLIRSPFWRGLKTPKLRSKEAYFDSTTREYQKSKPWKPAYSSLTLNGKKVLRPLKRDILTLCEGEVNISPKHLEIKHIKNGEEISSFQQYIVISGLPDMHFPSGREWIYELKDLPFPVWTSIRFEKKNYEIVANDINKRRKDLDDQIEHIKEAPGDDVKMPQMYMEQDAELDAAKYTVESEKKPFLYTTTIIAVASDNLIECQERAKVVQDYFDDNDIETQMPIGDQWELFNEMLIGSKRYAANDYIKPLTPEYLAGSMIGANNMIGDPLGFPIGTTGMLGKSVKYNPFRAPEINESPAVSFTGTLGRGKSLLANLIAILVALIGGRVLINDPKGERGNWSEVLTWLKPYINIIELSPAKEYKGTLDIYQIMLRSLGKNPTEKQKYEAAKQASEYALSILGTIAGYKTTDERMEYLADAVNEVTKDENPAMMKVIYTLGRMAEKAESEQTRDMYKRLEKTFINRINNTTYGHLLFGEGTEDVIDITKPLNILQTQNFIIPPEGKAEEDFTYQERVGMATLICTSAIGMLFAMQSREYFKLYIQDENSVFKRSTQGKAMQNRMIKMGRTENAGIYLIGQNISDVGETEDIKANIGVRFAFGTKALGEAKEILKYMGLNEESKELQEMLIDLPTGVCLMKDLEGRVSMIAVDPIFEEFLEAFDTKPVRKIDKDNEVATANENEEATQILSNEVNTEITNQDEEQIKLNNEIIEEQVKTEPESFDTLLKGWGSK